MNVNDETRKAAVKALHSAAEKGDTAAVNRLLVENADIIDERDSHLRTALHYAVISRHLQTADALLRNGAGVDASGGSDGFTPLHEAAFGGDTEMVKLLLHHGAKATQKTANDRTVLDLAGTNRNLYLTDTLKKAMGLDTGTVELLPPDEHAAGDPKPFAKRLERPDLIEAFVEWAKQQYGDRPGFRVIEHAAAEFLHQQAQDRTP